MQVYKYNAYFDVKIRTGTSVTHLYPLEKLFYKYGKLSYINLKIRHYNASFYL